MQPNKPVVLVVDDDPVNLDILVQTLEQDYFLIIAKNGKRALDLAFSHHPDLILLDILMPEMDGFEVCQRLKADKETEGIPVIFLSVMESPGQKHRGFEVGGVDYVTKPFHADEVLARVRTHITNKRLREELESHNMLIGMELHEKSRQLETLMNNLPGLAYQGEHSPDRKVRFVSQGVTRLTGYTPEHFMGPDGMGLLALVHPDDRAHVSETLENALRKKEPFELTYRIITSWNEEKWVWEQGAGVHAGGAGEQAPLLVEGFINDVTEKQKQDNTIRQENKELRERLKARCSGDIVGNSPQITAVFDLIAKAAAVDDNVVVYGESGTGKELAARAIHDGSSRYQQPFVAVNCGAIPESLFESELFGYKKGAFTGATADKKGYLDQADGGTLFLDELGEISLMGQVKLLRAIEHGGFTPVGGAQIHRPDVRIIAATNRDLLERVNEGAMRRDFYYRIHVIPIHLPPLRQRKEDIPLLIEYFLNAYPRVGDLPALNGEVMQAFMQYDWPGNVRELENTVEYAVSIETKPIISLSSLPERILKPQTSPAHCRSARDSFPQGGRQAPARPNTARPCRRNRWPRRWTASSGNTCSKRSAATTGSGRKRRISSASTAAPCSARSSSSIWRTKRANSPVQETPRPGIPSTRKLLGKGTDPIRPAGLGNKRKSFSPEKPLP